MSFSYEKILSKEGLRAILNRFALMGKPVVLDLETTGLDRHTDTIVSAQICVAGSEHAFYIPEEFVHLLVNLDCPLVLHNFKFDFAFLHMIGVDLRHLHVRDTMLMHHLLDENAEHGLDAIIQEKWNDPYKQVFWSRNKSFQEAPEAEAIEYACKDVIYTGILFCTLEQELQLSGVPSSLVSHVHKLAMALYNTEVSGVRLDLDYLVKVGQELKGRIDSADTRMNVLVRPELDTIELDMWLEQIQKAKDKCKTEKGKESAGARIKRPKFNWTSPVQLQRLIYGELDLPVQMKWNAKTKERKPTLEDAALEELAFLHPVVEELRNHRADEKVYGSFIEGTLERQVGGRIFPHFNINGTVTGRISSSNPNLQQLPREGGVRGIYVPDAGNRLISCDYGMLEVVIAAHYSQDPALLKIIYEGASKHDITAAALGIERQVAKTINFAMGYGATEHKIKSILGCSFNEAKHALNKYWEAYAGERNVINECQALVDAGKPIVSIFGRQRHFPSTFASEKDKARAYRQAYSSLVQGTGADVTHLAFYSAAARMKQLGGRALFEVHDEILIEVPEAVAVEASAELERIMVEAGVQAGLNVPLTADCSLPLGRWEK